MKRAGWAFLAGLGALLLVVGVAFIALLASFSVSTDESWLPQEPSEDPPVSVSDAFLLVPVGLLISGAFPARTLGVGWLWSFLVSIGALIASSLLVLALGPSFGSVLAAVAAAPALVALGASLLTNGSGATLVVALAAVVLAIAVYAAYPASTLAGFAVALSGWVVLPSVAGLFTPEDRAGG